MMHSSVRALVAATACVTVASLAPAASGAQVGVRASATPQGQSSPAQTIAITPAASASRISVSLRDVLVADAVRTIAAQANVSVMFASTALPNVRVTYQATDVTPHAALLAVLRETRMTAEPTREGFKIVPKGGEQGAGTVLGKVIDAKTKEPVADATIFVDDAQKGIVTGKDGTYRLSTGAGTHRITVRAVGYVRQMQQVIVSADQTVSVNFALDKSASVLSEVVVTGTVVATERKAIATPITIITAQDIERRNITRLDQLFRGEVPGVLAIERGSQSFSDDLDSRALTRVYSRGTADLGGGTNGLKTYVDGVELLDPAYLGTLDPKSIDRIEIITGPQAATIYGSGALGGVMQIFTKKGRGNSTDATLNLRYGMQQSSMSSGATPTHSHGLSLMGGSGPEFSYAGTASYEYMGQWQPQLFSRTLAGSFGVTHNRGPLLLSGSVSVSGLKNGVSAGGSLVNCIQGDPRCYSTLLEREWREEGQWGSSRGGTAGYFAQRVSHTSSQTIGLNVDYRVTPSWQHHVTLGRNAMHLAHVPERPTFTLPDDTLYKSVISDGSRSTVSYNTTFVPHLGALSAHLTVGGNAAYGERTTVTGCKPSEGTTALATCNAFTPLSVTTAVNDRNWGGFGTARVGLFEQLFLTAGIRGERNPSYGVNHVTDWTPTAGLTYTTEIGDLTLKLLGSYGSATRPPAPEYRQRKMMSVSGMNVAQYEQQRESLDLTPEYSRGPQGGFELYYGNLGSLTVNRYVQNVRNLIGILPVDSMQAIYVDFNFPTWLRTYQYLNIGAMRQQGWESTASLNIGALSLKGTYSWNDSRVTANNLLNYVGIYQAGEMASYIPTHTGNFTASYALRGTSVTLVSNYVGKSNQDGVLIPREYLMGAGRLRMYALRSYGGGFTFAAASYVKSDLAISQRITSWATGTLNVTNLTNSFASDVSGLYPSLGRLTLIGISLRAPTAR